MSQKNIIFIFLVFFSLTFTSALSDENNIYSDCTIYGNCQPISGGGTTNINQTINNNTYINQTANLTNYYQKNETYNQSEINNNLSNYYLNSNPNNYYNSSTLPNQSANLTGYATLNGSNQPFTGDLLINKTNPCYNMTNPDDGTNHTICKSTNGSVIFTNTIGSAVAYNFSIYINGTAGSFDGINDYAEAPDSDLLEPKDNVTWSVWFKPIGAGTNADEAYVYMKGRKASVPYSQWAMTYLNGTTLADGTKAIALYYYTSGSVSKGLLCNATFNEWNHIVFVKNSTNLMCYKNGELANITSATLPIVYNAMTTETLTIGAARFSGSYNRQFHGYIDEFMVLNRTLDSSEISTLYNAGLGKEFYNYNESLKSLPNLRYYYQLDNNGIDYIENANGSLVGLMNYSTQHGVFNGSLNMTRKLNNSALASFLIDPVVEQENVKAFSIWFKTNTTITSTTTPTNTPFLQPFMFSNVSGQEVVIWLGASTIYCTNEVITIANLQPGLGNRRSCVSSTEVPSIEANRWHNLILNWDGTKYAFYFNGRFVTSGSGTAAHVLSLNMTNPMGIGGGWGGASNYYGVTYADEIMIFTDNITTEHIQTIYNAGAERLAYYRFNENFTGTQFLEEKLNPINATLTNGATWITSPITPDLIQGEVQASNTSTLNYLEVKAAQSESYDSEINFGTNQSNMTFKFKDGWFTGITTFFNTTYFRMKAYFTDGVNTNSLEVSDSIYYNGSLGVTQNYTYICYDDGITQRTQTVYTQLGGVVGNTTCA